MRKTNLLLFFLFCPTIVNLISCASTSRKESLQVVTEITYESENPSVTLEISPDYDYGIISGGFNGFNCTFSNKTDKIAKIVWAESSINYNGNSYVPFIDGQKYLNAQTPMSPSAIAKGGTISKSVYSSAQPHFYSSTYYSGWNMSEIEADEVQLLFQVKATDKEEYITATVKVLPIEPTEKSSTLSEESSINTIKN